MSRFDWIGLAEAAYRLDSSETEWCQELGRILGQEFNQGSGYLGGLVARDRQGFFLQHGVSHEAPPFGLEISRMSWKLQPRTSEQFFGSRGYVLNSELASNASSLISGWFGRLGVAVADGCGLMAGDEQGQYFGVMALSKERCKPLGAKRRAAWKHAAAHIGAGLRLRRNLQSVSLDDPAAEALIDHRGELAHAGPHLQQEGIRQRLHQIWQQRQRGMLGEARNESESLQLWPALFSGRWSLVDRYDTDGQRFLVAYRNGVSTADPRALSARESQVAHRLAVGASYTDIAEDLSVSESAVRSHGANLLKKLGMSSPMELVLHWSALQEGMSFSVRSQEVMVARAQYPPRPHLPRFTNAERAVVEGLLGGASNAEIAGLRRVGIRTVETQITSIYAKLSVSSRRELAALIFGEQVARES